MQEIIPRALQRLRIADVVHMVGLTSASIGQEFARLGVVQDRRRDEGRLSALVDTTSESAEHVTAAIASADASGPGPGRYTVVVSVEGPDDPDWRSECSCGSPDLFCVHAAALLYDWLAHPQNFVVGNRETEVYSIATSRPEPVTTVEEPKTRVKPNGGSGPSARQTLIQGVSNQAGIEEILVQLSVGELRGIAREYAVHSAGQNKEQLVKGLLVEILQPEAIRRVVGRLDKPQRQLLAALTLVGGALPYEELRALSERLSLGKSALLQQMLTSLQSHGLLFRTTPSGSATPRMGLSGAVLEAVWIVPAEVRSALRVTIPVPAFDLKAENQRLGGTLQVRRGQPYQLLADLLLVARALQLTPDVLWQSTAGEVQRAAAMPEPQQGRVGLPMTDSSIDIPPPPDIPSLALLNDLQQRLQREPEFIRFMLRLLRLVDILYGDDEQGQLHILATAAQALLSTNHADAAGDLLHRWLTQTCYDELYDLQTPALRLRCRTTAFRLPALRPGELSGENSEARQSLIGLLAQAPVEQWIDFAAFMRFVYRLSPFVLQKRQRLYPSPHWWFEADGRILKAANSKDWQVVEGRYLEQLIRGPLHWWGLCDLVFSPKGQILAFRLEESARKALLAVLNESEAEPLNFTPVPPAGLDITRSGSLCLPCVITNREWLELIEPLAEITSIEGQQLCYTLTPRSMSNAFSRGIEIEPLLELLRHHLAEVAWEEPEQATNCQYLLDQLESARQRFGRIRIYEKITYIDVANPMALREVKATTSLDRQRVFEIQPTRVILKRSGADQLKEELKRRGLAPLIHPEDSYGAE